MNYSMFVQGNSANCIFFALIFYLYVVVKEPALPPPDPRHLTPNLSKKGKIEFKCDSLIDQLSQMVGLTGFEPVTLRLSSACSNQLSYRPPPRACAQISNLTFEILTSGWWS